MLPLLRTRASLSTLSPDASSGVPRIFDRALKMRQRNALGDAAGRPRRLHRHAAASLADRLLDVKGMAFPTALTMGMAEPDITDLLRSADVGIERLLQLDGAHALVKDALATPLARVENDEGRLLPDVVRLGLVGDEELLPFGPHSELDLVVANMTLHWVNDVPGVLAQIQSALRPDGLFLAACLGGETLSELRMAWALAEQERLGGVSPRISPMAGVADIGNLLTRTRFGLPAVDFDRVTIWYEDVVELVEHLREMGETQAALGRRMTASRDTFTAMAAAYQAMFADEDGRIPATFQIIYMTGWAPAASQQQPLKRGSATRSLEEIAEPSFAAMAEQYGMTALQVSDDGVVTPAKDKE